MCDMRNLDIVGFINLTTYPNIQFGAGLFPVYRGFNDPALTTAPTGLYQTIATGCGYYYYDGLEFKYYD